MIIVSPSQNVAVLLDNLCNCLTVKSGCECETSTMDTEMHWKLQVVTEGGKN